MEYEFNEMIYNIDYIPSDSKSDDNGLPILSVDFYMRKIEGDEWIVFQQQYPKSELWITEIKAETYGYGLTHFVKDNLKNDKFNVQEFADDIDRMENIADFIDYLSDCHPKPYKEAEKYHYNKIKPILDGRINEFVKKYNLKLIVD